MSNRQFQDTINNSNEGPPPIWFMRQAGRYHSHYRKLKEKSDFMTLCKDPILAAQVALGPIEEFDFDVSILFSDLLFPLEAMGIGLTYNPGPELSFLLNPDNISQLDASKAVEFLNFQKQAVQETRKVLPDNKSLIGFVGGPWTLYTYAAEGAHKGNLIASKTQMNLFHDLCSILIPVLLQNIRLQLDGGAEVVMIFDTAAGELSPIVYQEHVLPEINKLISAFPRKLGYYAKGVQHSHFDHEVICDRAWAGLGFDHRWNLPEVLQSQKYPGFVQGNFDQTLLFCDTPTFKTHLHNYLEPFKALDSKYRRRWVSGLGHGVLPKTPEAHVKFMVEEIRRVFGD